MSVNNIPPANHRSQTPKSAIISRIKILVLNLTTKLNNFFPRKKKNSLLMLRAHFISTNISSLAHHRTQFHHKTTPTQKPKIKIFIQFPKNQNRIFQKHKTHKESSKFLKNSCGYQRNCHFQTTKLKIFSRKMKNTVPNPQNS